MSTWQVILLGILEGLTEFIPVSSTGHLVLAGHLLGFDSPGKTFEILIQLGAILAILTVYFGKLWHILTTLPRSRETQRFVGAVLVAFLPAALIGLAFHKQIKSLLGSPLTVCVTLVLGGFVLLAIDRWKTVPRFTSMTDIPISTALGIGVCQCLAMIPGVSRSGATIVGAMLMGTDKRTAAEFSFFLALPTMAGAFAVDLVKNYSLLDAAAVRSIALGFVVAFACGVLVVRYLLDFVSRHGFAPFAWWRIIVGGVGLGALLSFGY
ncbi:MAG TPA: undecaprenyl-diphosphate phosphatase [Hyphomicrobiaceae bacterium]|nr:undecaprenyl-diphosphate phosphatase [Hyphomicrobiaceae bacterium]